MAALPIPPPIKIGFLGCGWIAGEHARHLAAIPQVQLTACYDTNATAATKLAQQYNLRTCDDQAKVINASDAVYVCSPPGAHAEQLLACFARGRSVYTEKPLSISLEDAKRIVDAAKSAPDVIAAIGFNFRFFEAWAKAREIIQAGKIGTPQMFTVQRIHPGPSGGWRRDPANLCGMTIESVSHDIDLMRWVLGDYKQVSAMVKASDPQLPKFDDALCATLTTTSGAIGSLQIAWSSAVAFSARHAIVGSEGTLAIESPNVWDFSTLRYRSHNDLQETVFEYESEPQMRHAAICQHFVNTLLGKEPNALPLEDGLYALEVCTALLNSAARDGQWITLTANRAPLQVPTLTHKSG